MEVMRIACDLCDSVARSIGVSGEGMARRERGPEIVRHKRVEAQPFAWSEPDMPDAQYVCFGNEMGSDAAVVHAAFKLLAESRRPDFV